jgi:hypothetical protein
LAYSPRDCRERLESAPQRVASLGSGGGSPYPLRSGVERLPLFTLTVRAPARAHALSKRALKKMGGDPKS